MPRFHKWPPTIYHHKASGQDRIRIWVAGRPRYIDLGPHGSDRARKEYTRILAEQEVARAEAKEQIYRERIFLPGRDPNLAELAGVYFSQVIEPRARAGRLSESSATAYRNALRALRELYGHRPAKEFTARQLEALRRQLGAQPRCQYCRPERTCKRCRRGEPVILSKSYLNAIVGCIRRFIRWAAKEEQVPTSVWESVRTLEDLRTGDELGREARVIQPASEESVKAIRPFLRRPLAALLDLAPLTGVRPSELLTLRPGDLDKSGRVEVAPGQWVDTGGKVWTYRPLTHKNAWRGQGHVRLILFGPKAQEVLKPFLMRPETAYCFCPREAVADLHQERATRRKVPAGQGNGPGRNRKTAPKIQPGQHYSRRSLERAVKRACVRAGVQPFSPYQLRHLAAARLFEEFGDWDLVRTVLGHRTLEATRIYTPDRIRAAAEALGKIG